VKAGFSVWNGRIAPVFDVARTLLIVEATDNAVSTSREVQIPEGVLPLRAEFLAGLGVGDIVCGAVSHPFRGMLEDCGMHVIPFISGGVDEVIQAWLEGRIPGRMFDMPGCFRGGAGPNLRCGRKRFGWGCGGQGRKPGHTSGGNNQEFPMES